jgi:hypothetical protein
MTMEQLDKQQPQLADPVEYWKTRCKNAEIGMWEIYAQLMQLRQVARAVVKLASEQQAQIEMLKEIIK